MQHTGGAGPQTAGRRRRRCEGLGELAGADAGEGEGVADAGVVGAGAGGGDDGSEGVDGGERLGAGGGEDVDVSVDEGGGAGGDGGDDGGGGVSSDGDVGASARGMARAWARSRALTNLARPHRTRSCGRITAAGAAQLHR